MPRRKFVNISIPTTWTSQQALDVIDFLEEIYQAIWALHEESIMEAHIEKDLRNCVASDDDEMPF